MAASSSPEGVQQARALASRLEGLGMTNAFAWWEHVSAPAFKWCEVAEAEIDAAVACDVFVILGSDPQSVGAHVELGGRFASGQVAYVVGWGVHEFFCAHPLVRRVESVDELLVLVAGGEGEPHGAR